MGVVGFTILFFGSFVMAYLISNLIGLILGITSFLSTIGCGVFYSDSNLNTIKQMLRKSKIKKLTKILNKKLSKQKIDVKSNYYYTNFKNENTTKKDNINTKIIVKDKYNKQTIERNK